MGKIGTLVAFRWVTGKSGGVGMILRTLAIALAIVISAASAQAAEIVQITGGAAVNKGDGFVPASVGTQLIAGNRVMAGKGSEATISFGPDCEIRIFDGETYRIPEDPQCGGAAYVPPSELSQLQVTGLGLLGAGAAIGIGAWIAIAVSDSDGGAPRRKPASP